MEIIKWHKAKFEKNALVIDETVSITEWKELGQNLRQIEGCVQFWIGDWARFGDKKGFTGKYTDPKVYDELEEITGLSRQTIKDYKYIAESTSSLRNDDLSFNHHKEVAKLTPEKQELFLQKASEEKLSVRDLRNEIKKSEIQVTQVKTTVSDNIINGDSLEVLQSLEDGCIDVLLTDPPYGIDYISNRSVYDNSITKRGLLNDGKEEAFQLLDNTCKILVNKMAENSHLYFFCSWSVFTEFKEIISKYFTIKTPIVWDKGNKGSGDLDNDWGNQTELIIYCVKGKKMVNTRKGNVINVSRLHSSKMVHPTQKPIDLIKEILEVSALSSDFIVDPFMGSGSTIKACNELGFKSLGIELDNEMFNIANNFING
jgi:site-specific DNA-methyltransferase (adenine-specific)